MDATIEFCVCSPKSFNTRRWRTPGYALAATCCVPRHKDRLYPVSVILQSQLACPAAQSTGACKGKVHAYCRSLLSTLIDSNPLIGLRSMDPFGRRGVFS